MSFFQECLASGVIQRIVQSNCLGSLGVLWYHVHILCQINHNTNGKTRSVTCCGSDAELLATSATPAPILRKWSAELLCAGWMMASQSG
jgi:hypothetical protein